MQFVVMLAVKQFGLRNQFTHTPASVRRIMKNACLQFRSDRGATMLETALMLPLFLLIILVSFDLLRLAYNCLTLRYVAATVMRAVTVGELNSEQAIKDRIIGMAGGLATAVAPEDITLCRLEDYPCVGWSQGAGKDLVVLQVNANPVGFVMKAAEGFGLDRRAYAIGFRVIGRIEP